MFGYIRASKPEMRIKEFELYKAVYCSLCKELGRNYGLLARFTLNYDFTFLALFSMSLNEDSFNLKKKSCTCNPLKKCMYLDKTDNLKMPAATAMILLYYKLLDNTCDETGIKKLCFKFLKNLFSSAHKKAAKEFPHIEQIIADYSSAQQLIERDNCNNIDMAAEPTALCMEKLFCLLSDNENDKRCLARFGYGIGRFIYILDAAADFDDDKKQNKYNPFILEGGLSVDKVKCQLNICIAESAKAYELLDIKKFKNILDNIIYLGLEDTFKKELKI